jgi:hypothetical protein
MRRSDFPALYLTASELSRRGQRSYKQWILANLALVVLAAMLSAISTWIPTPFEGPFTIAIAVVLLGAMATNVLNQQMQGDRDWFDGRAVAESIKTNVWRYMMQVPPFDNERVSDRTFAARLTAILTEYRTLNYNLAALPGEMHQITPRMRQIRQLAWPDRRRVYVQDRLKEEVRWYRGKAAAARSSSSRWLWASFGAEFAGVLIALTTFISPVTLMINLVGVVAALAAAFQAWTQVNRHAELSHSYALACQELVVIGDLMAEAETEDAFVTAVENSEEAISREHTMWVAKRTQ